MARSRWKFRSCNSIGCHVLGMLYVFVVTVRPCYYLVELHTSKQEQELVQQKSICKSFFSAIYRLHTSTYVAHPNTRDQQHLTQAESEGAENENRRVEQKPSPPRIQISARKPSAPTWLAAPLSFLRFTPKPHTSHLHAPPRAAEPEPEPPPPSRIVFLTSSSPHRIAFEIFKTPQSLGAGRPDHSEGTQFFRPRVGASSPTPPPPKPLANLP